MPAVPDKHTYTRLLLMLLGLGFILYFNSLGNSYAIDDELYALNPAISPGKIQSMHDIFSSRTFHDGSETGYAYRPIALASYAIEYHVFGKKPWISHSVNLLLYLLIIVITFKVLSLLFKNAWVAFLAVLLFTVHPVHSEVVCNLKCRDDLLAFAGSMLAFLFAIRYAASRKPLLLAAVAACFAFAFLSKPSAAPFIIAIPFSVCYFSRHSLKQGLYLFLSLLSVTLLFAAINKMGLPHSQRVVLFHENPLVSAPFAARFPTALSMLGRYLLLLFFPAKLLFYYGYSYIQVASWRDLCVWLSLAAHLLLAAIAVWQYRSRSILGYGILFYLVQISMYANIVQLFPGMMAERFAFAASLGFCIAVAALALTILKIGAGAFSWNIFQQKPMYVFYVACILLSTRTMVRNKNWKDKATLYSHDIKSLETSVKANLLYGSLLSEQGLASKNKALVEQSKHYYLQATKFAPRYALAWENLGTVCYFLGDKAGALSAFNQAIAVDPTYGKTYFDKAILCEQSGYPALAESYYRQGIASDSAFIPGYSQLARLYAQRKQAGQAIVICEKGLKFDKTDQLESELTGYYMAKGDTSSAVAHAEKAVEINPQNPERIKALAIYFERAGNHQKALYYQGLTTVSQ